MKASAYKAAVYTSGIAAATIGNIAVYDNFYVGTPAALPASTTAFTDQDVKLITETNATTGVTTAVAIQYRTRTLDAVTAVSAIAGAESVTVASLIGTKSTAATSKVVFGDTVAKGDVVLVTYVNTATTDYYILEKAKTVTGAVTAVNTSAADGTYVTVNGTSYWAGALAGTTTGVSYSGIPSTSGATQYNFYLNNFGDVMGYTPVTAVSTAYDLAVVADVDHILTGSAFTVDTYKYVAQVLLADGTYGVYEIASYNGKAVVESVTSASTQIAYATIAAVPTYSLYNASIDANGKVVLKDLATYGAGFTPAVAAGTITNPLVIKGNAVAGDAIYATANTMYFYTSGAFGASNFVFRAYKGYTNAATMSGNPTVSSAATYTSAGTVYAAGIVYTGTAAEVSTADVYYYDGAYTTVVSGATTTVTYKLYKAGVVEDYAVSTVGATKPVAQVAKGFYVKKAVTTAATGLAAYTDTAVLNQTVAGFASNILVTAASKYYTTDTATVVDLRTATEIATSSATYGVGAVSSVAGIAAAQAASCTLNFQVLYSVGGTLALDGTAAKPLIAQYIFVTSPSAVATLESVTINGHSATLHATAQAAWAGTKVTGIVKNTALTTVITKTAVDAAAVTTIHQAFTTGATYTPAAFTSGTTTLSNVDATVDVLRIVVTAASGATQTYYTAVVTAA